MNKTNQQIKGRMAVYAGNHKLIEQRLYYTSAGMKRVMSEWLADYPDASYITVRPYIDEEKQVYRVPIPVSNKLKQPIKRPPAVYDNSCKSLYP